MVECPRGQCCASLTSIFALARRAYACRVDAQSVDAWLCWYFRAKLRHLSASRNLEEDECLWVVMSAEGSRRRYPVSRGSARRLRSWGFESWLSRVRICSLARATHAVPRSEVNIFLLQRGSLTASSTRRHEIRHPHQTNFRFFRIPRFSGRPAALTFWGRAWVALWRWDPDAGVCINIAAKKGVVEDLPHHGLCVVDDLLH